MPNEMYNGRKKNIYLTNNHTIIDCNIQKEKASNFHIPTNDGGDDDTIEMTTQSVGFNHLRGAPTGLIEPEKKHKTRVVIEVINCVRREIR